MSAPTCVFDSLNINDGTTYTIMPDIELGARIKTYSSRKSYTGAVAQYNVSEAYEIPMRFPMKVQGSSLADLDAKVQAINTKIDGCSSAAPKNLVFAGVTYQIISSPRIAYTLDAAAGAGFFATFDLVLNRVP